MIRKKKISLLRIIVYVIVIMYLIAVVHSCLPHNYSDEENIEYIQTNLHNDYHKNFHFLKREYSEKDSRTLYYFYPEDNADLVITTYCGESNAAGMVNTIIPFEYHRYYHDNLEEVITEKVIAKSKIQKIDLRTLTTQNLDEIIDDIYDLITEIKKNYEIYDIYFRSVYLDVYDYDGEKIDSQVFCYDKYYIRDRLWELMNKTLS